MRGCFRHLCYLEDLLEKCEKHVLIDPTLIHFSYAYCASHVHGNRSVGLEFMLKIRPVQNIFFQYITVKSLSFCVSTLIPWERAVIFWRQC